MGDLALECGTNFKKVKNAMEEKREEDRLAFEEIKSGRLKLEDKILISENAWRKGGSKMFVKVNDEVAVSDILRGIIVQSGNDAAIALAEHLQGSEVAFADKMTKKARDLGLSKAKFKNVSVNFTRRKGNGSRLRLRDSTSFVRACYL